MDSVETNEISGCDAQLVDEEKGLWLRQCGCEACALYICMECGRKWATKPHAVTCGMCNSVQVRWVNYERWSFEHERAAAVRARVLQELEGLLETADA